MGLKGVLDDTDRRAVREVFGGLAGDRVPIDPPIDAGGGVRWTDVYSAALFACDQTEMAIVRMVATPEGYDVQLKTIEDYPGRMLIHARPHPQVYEAQATIGLYGDRTERARQLLVAFDDQMRAFGRKRQIQTPYE